MQIPLLICRNDAQGLFKECTKKYDFNTRITGDITLVAKYLGHSKIDETLNTYFHMYQNRLDTIVNIIERQNDKYLTITWT